MTTNVFSAYRMYIKGNILILGFTVQDQCSTTGVTKVVVCAILSVGWCI